MITMVQFYTILWVVGGIFAGAILWVSIWAILRSRKWVIIAQEGRRALVKRTFQNLDHVYKWNGGKYLIGPGCVGYINGKKAIYIRPGVPGAIQWPWKKWNPLKTKSGEIDSKTGGVVEWKPISADTIKWEGQTIEEITATINSEHYINIVTGDRNRLLVKDILIMILIGVGIAIGLITLFKVYGKPVPVQCLPTKEFLAALKG